MSAAVVRALFDAMQARDWAAARSLVTDDAVIEWPISGERFRGAGFVEMNEAYPEGWTIRVHDVVADRDRVAARVEVEHDGDTFWCAGFDTTDGERVTGGVEIWATAGSEQPPEWRCAFGLAR